MGKHLQLFGISLLGGLALLALLLASGAGPGPLQQLHFGGRSLLAVLSPEGDQVLAVGRVEVLISFSEERVLPETFRCLLNSEDVTERLSLAANGVAGKLHGLVEGENRLRFEIFGESLWPGRYLEEVREIRIQVAPLPPLDRARLAPIDRSLLGPSLAESESGV